MTAIAWIGGVLFRLVGWLYTSLLHFWPHQLLLFAGMRSIISWITCILVWAWIYTLIMRSDWWPFWTYVPSLKQNRIHGVSPFTRSIMTLILLPTNLFLIWQIWRLSFCAVLSKTDHQLSCWPMRRANGKMWTFAFTQPWMIANPLYNIH